MTTAPSQASDHATIPLLRRLLAHAGGMRAYSSSSGAGLFPSKLPGNRQLLEELLAREWITLEAPAGRPARVRLTRTGRDWLLAQEDPRLLLEDLLRAFDHMNEQWTRIVQLCQQQSRALDQERADVARVLARWTPPGPPGSGGNVQPSQLAEPKVTAILLKAIEASNGSGVGATTLAEWYREALAELSVLSIGTFHDAVRALHGAGLVRLSPWTGPLYQLPNPDLAMLIGHEVLYYVRLQHDP